MHAQQLTTPGPATTRPLEKVERPEPEPGPGEVLIDVSACAVCRTDLQLVEGDLAMHRRPVIPGHQVVGRVRLAGPGVSLPPGTRVGVAWIAGACGVCDRCRRGLENLCEAATFTGWDVDGGYATSMLARADFTHRLPDGFDDLAAAPLLCGGVIGYRALELTGLEAGQRLGLYGFGASATIVVQLAVDRELEVHVATRDPGEQQRALALGAASVGGYADPPPRALHSAITFAPVGSVVIDALRAVDRGGSVVVNAIHLDHVPEFDYDLLWHERSIRSVANVTRADCRGLLDAASTIGIETHTRAYGFDQAGDALVDLARGRVPGAAVLVR